VVAASLAGSTIFLAPANVAAIGVACGSAWGLHYAGQVTSTNATFTQCGTTTEYQGWNGINGQIQTPGTTLTLGNYQEDRVSGYLSAQLNSDSDWVQTGWFTGTITNQGVPPSSCDPPVCVQRSGSYGRFVENQGPTGYQIEDFGTVALNSVVTSRVVYNASTGCWEAYLTYSGSLAMEDCFDATSSGAMLATTEMDSVSGVTVPLPPALFGTSNSNTNQALRLHGGSGWVPWNQSSTTERFDERYTTPKYRISGISSCCWYFESYLS
jgi:hypothetical protein